MSRRVHHYFVPVDGQLHKIQLHGPIRHVTASTPTEVEFWAENDTDADPRTVHLQVFGTGHLLPDAAVWAGTARVHGLVWHLFEMPA